MTSVGDVRVSVSVTSGVGYISSDITGLISALLLTADSFLPEDQWCMPLCWRAASQEWFVEAAERWTPSLGGDQASFASDPVPG